MRHITTRADRFQLCTKKFFSKSGRLAALSKPRGPAPERQAKHPGLIFLSLWDLVGARSKIVGQLVRAADS